MIGFIAFMVWALNRLIDLYILLIVVWALLTWFPGALRSRLGTWLTRLVGPYLQFFERIIPPIGGLSFAPVVALIVLYLVQAGIRMIGALLGA